LPLRKSNFSQKKIFSQNGGYWKKRMALRISYNLEDITYFTGEMFCELMITEGNKQERQSPILTLPFLKLT
jgi:hypothetical protein